ncbi:hypothetical protein [Marinilactibacillus sp. 15R]|uniref:hypothetical protein n=1 Tax=Marinilactibacillus sp. 15R TaxID=1911586 RepID=UPI001E4AE89C|nr:hypothetical protein [Marinilactibacillus sp. 15R]
MKLNIHWTEIFNIFEKLKNLEEIKQEDLDNIRINFSHQQELVRTSFSSDACLMGYWLIEQLQSGNSYYRNIFYGDKIISIKIKTEMIPLIIESINDEFSYRYSVFKDIISDDLIRIIYESFYNEKFFLNDKQILENFPESFLETRLLQRILVNIDNEVGLNNSLLNKLINKIDFSDAIFGSELTDFINNRKNIIEELGIEVLEDYYDGIGGGESGIVHPKSFIDKNQILNEDIKTLAQILLTSKDESFSKREDFFSEKTYQETSNFLISSLNRKDKISEKVQQLIIDNGLQLYPKYEKLFVELIIKDDYASELKTKALNVFLQNYHFDRFSWEEKHLFKELIDKEKFDHPAFCKLLKVDVNKLNYEYVYANKKRPELLDINDFINTELGRFLDVLIQLNKKAPSKYSEIKSIVSIIKENQFKEFTQGALTTVESSIDIDKITINTFQGYCYSIYGFKKEEFEKFVPAGKELLRKGYVNDFNKNNLFILSLSMINPSNTEVNWTDINFSQMIDVILKTNMKYQYEYQWTEEIILNDKDGEYGRRIVYSLTNEDALIDKSEEILEIFQKYSVNYIGKINIDLLPDRISGQEDIQKKELFIRLFFILLDNANIERSYFGSRSLGKLIKLLNLDFKKKLINHSKLSTVLSPLEIENLRREID